MFLAFKNGVKSIQTGGYNGARTVVLVYWFDCKGFIQHKSIGLIGALFLYNFLWSKHCTFLSPFQS